jgi:hypothetical protein
MLFVSSMVPCTLSEHSIAILLVGSNDYVFTFLTCGKKMKEQKSSKICLGGFMVGHGFCRCLDCAHSLGPCRAFLPWSSGCIDSVSSECKYKVLKKQKKGVVLTVTILHSS